MVLFGLDGKRAWDGMFKSEEQKMREYKKQVAEQAENDFIQGTKLRANLDEAEYDEMTAHKLARLYNTVLSKQTESKVLKVVKTDTPSEIREMKEKKLMSLKNKPTPLSIEDREEIPMLGAPQKKRYFSSYRVEELIDILTPNNENELNELLNSDEYIRTTDTQKKKGLLYQLAKHNNLL